MYTSGTVEERENGTGTVVGDEKRQKKQTAGLLFSFFFFFASERGRKDRHQMSFLGGNQSSVVGGSCVVFDANEASPFVERLEKRM